MYIAHRGNCRDTIPGTTENTIDAFMKCVESEVEAIEFDVHATFDNFLIVVHDARLHDYLIGDLTLKEVHMIDNKIPLLADVLDVIGENIIIDIEVKPHGVGKILGEFLKKYLQTKKRNIVVTSFIHKETLDCKLLVPQIEIGWIYRCLSVGMIRDVLEYEIPIVVIGECVVDEESLKQLKENHRLVWIYTLNDKNKAILWKRRGVDGIVTDTLA